MSENGDGPGPFGSKGVGESGAIAVSPAIGAAVSAAVGERFRELPITAERVWEAVSHSLGTQSDPHSRGGPDESETSGGMQP